MAQNDKLPEDVRPALRVHTFIEHRHQITVTARYLLQLLRADGYSIPDDACVEVDDRDNSTQVEWVTRDRSEAESTPKRRHPGRWERRRVGAHDHTNRFELTTEALYEILRTHGIPVPDRAPLRADMSNSMHAAHGIYIVWAESDAVPDEVPE